MGLSISPDDLAKYIPIFRTLPVWWQLLIVGGLIAVAFGVTGWRVALAHYRERIETQKVIIDNYRAQGLSPDEISSQKRRLAEVQGELTDIKKMFWRKLTDNEKAELKTKVAAVGKYSFRVISAHPADCHQLAGELTKVLESAGWERKVVPAHLEEYGLDDWELAHTSGIRILGNYPSDNQPGSKLFDILEPLIRGGIMFGASRSGESVDVLLFVGPKGSPSMLPEK